jgi:hypothetical protein
MNVVASIPVGRINARKVGLRVSLLVGIPRNTEVVHSPLSAHGTSAARVEKVLVDQDQVPRLSFDDMRWHRSKHPLGSKSKFSDRASVFPVV